MLWGGKLIDESTPRRYMGAKSLLEEAAALNAGPSAEFAAGSSGGQPLDGFCLEIPCAEYDEVERLGEYVCHVLAKLAELDPAPLSKSPGCEVASLSVSTQSIPTSFLFAFLDFSKPPSLALPLCWRRLLHYHVFARLQAGLVALCLWSQESLPIVSIHDVVWLSWVGGGYTRASATNWTNPTSLRDRTRVAFEVNGCPYHIPEELPYPVAEHIVKPDKDDGTTCIRWWDNLEATKSDADK